MTQQKVLIAPITERQSKFWKSQNMPLIMLRSFLIECQSAGYEFRNRNELLKFMEDWPQTAPKIESRRTREQISFHVNHYKQNFDRFGDTLERVEFRTEPNEKLPSIEFRTTETLNTL